MSLPEDDRSTVPHVVVTDHQTTSLVRCEVPAVMPTSTQTKSKALWRWGHVRNGIWAKILLEIRIATNNRPSAHHNEHLDAIEITRLIVHKGVGEEATTFPIIAAGER